MLPVYSSPCSILKSLNWGGAHQSISLPSGFSLGLVNRLYQQEIKGREETDIGGINSPGCLSASLWPVSLLSALIFKIQFKTWPLEPIHSSKCPLPLTSSFDSHMLIRMTNHITPGVFKGRRFCIPGEPKMWQRLETFLPSITGEGCYWHPVGWSQGCC